MYLKEVIKTIYNSNGKLTINENVDGYKSLRPFTRTEYKIFKEVIGKDFIGMKPVTNMINEVNESLEYEIYKRAVNEYTGMQLTSDIIKECKTYEKNIITEQRVKNHELALIVEIAESHVKKKQSFKNKSVIAEDDVKVKNPETGREILAKSAISAGPSHPAYKSAKTALGGKEDSNGGKEQPKSDNGKEGGDDHHDDVSAGVKMAGAALDVAMKLGGSSMAGVLGTKVVAGVTEVAKRYKGAEGDKAIDKVKNMGKEAKEQVKQWKDDKKAAFAASITDETTGERKSMGNILKSKAKGLLKGAKNAIVHEVEHIGHGLKEGGEFLKKAVTDPKNITKEDWKKAASGIEAAAHVGIVAVAIGGAVASGGGTIAAMGAVGGKAAKIAVRDGALSALLTAHMYTDMQRLGLMNDKIINENDGRLLQILCEKEVDKITDDTFLEHSNTLISDGLQHDESPASKYDEENMNDLVKMSSEMIDFGEGLSEGITKSKSKEGGEKEDVKESAKIILKGLQQYSHLFNKTNKEIAQEAKKDKKLRAILEATDKLVSKKLIKK